MKYVTPELSTERLILKRGSAEDFKVVYEYDFTKLRDICGEFAYVKLDPKRIEGFENAADEEDTLNWILFLKDSMVPIGDLVADRVDHDANRIVLAFNLHPDYWGQGYMREAVVRALEHLFTELDFESVICGYDEGNVKSKRFIEKLNFDPFKTTPNAWQKNERPITTYDYIMRKDRFYGFYT